MSISTDIIALYKPQSHCNNDIFIHITGRGGAQDGSPTDDVAFARFGIFADDVAFARFGDLPILPILFIPPMSWQISPPGGIGTEQNRTETKPNQTCSVPHLFVYFAKAY